MVTECLWGPELACFEAAIGPYDACVQYEVGAFGGLDAFTPQCGKHHATHCASAAQLGYHNTYIDDDNPTKHV